MKNRVLYALMQPTPQNSYWAELIREGVSSEARERGYSVSLLSLESMPADINRRFVLVVGHRAAWLEDALAALNARGAQPIIVNACMLPLQRLRYSGTTFELEGMLERLLSLLRAAGRTKTVLLGTNPASLSDRVKSDAFLRAGDAAAERRVIAAEGRLEDCVDGFISVFASAGWDSVICANDTVAVCLIQKLTAAGVSLPKELYIIGMGNFYAEHLLPISLTSVMFDYRHMGEAAVELYYNLEHSRTACRMRVSLPCHLLLRDSAPLACDIEECVGGAPEAASPDDEYFAGACVQNIIRIEAILQAADQTDREILYGIAAGESCDAIGERLFFSGRAVRYRLEKILARHGFCDRDELKAALFAVTGDTNKW